MLTSSSLLLAVLGAWQTPTYLLGDFSGDLFGYSVDISNDGRVLAVGAPMYSSYRGYVKVLAFDGGSWSQRGSSLLGDLVAPGKQDRMGESVALNADGTILAASAIWTNDAGVVKVWQWVGGTWLQLGSTLNGEAEGDLFGSDVELSADGTVLAVSAYSNDVGGSLANAGHVRVFAYSGGAWLQRGSDIDGLEAGGMFGRAIALSADGSILAASGWKQDTKGYVRVFAFSSGSWQQRGADIDVAASAEGTSAPSGVALACDGTVVAIGARRTNSNSGQLSVFTFDGSEWASSAAPVAGSAASMLGRSVALSGDATLVAAGASSTAPSLSGAALTWTLGAGSLTSFGDHAGLTNSQLGYSVALSADGARLAAGRPYPQTGKGRVLITEATSTSNGVPGFWIL